MSEWIYSGDKNEEMKKPMKKFIDLIEKELIQLLFLETSLVFDYEINIQQFDKENFDEKNFSVQIVCFIEGNYNRKFVLMTFYFTSIFLYPISIQWNYIEEDITNIENELKLKKILNDKMKSSFFQMVDSIDKNVKLITLNSDNIRRVFFNRSYSYEQYEFYELNKNMIKIQDMDTLPTDLKTNPNNRSQEKYNNKRWTKKEKKIIIDNILSYREDIIKEDSKENIKKKTDLFAKKLLNLDINGVFKERSIKALSNRIAYFDELLAGVKTKYSQVDNIYFGKLRRIDNDISKNKARIWR